MEEKSKNHLWVPFWNNRLHLRKYRITGKFKSSLKKWVNLREVKNDGSFFPRELSDHDMVSKTLPGDVFSSTITHMKISKKFMKNFFLKFWHFFKFYSFLRIFSLLNYVIYKKWLKQRLNRSMFKWIGSSKDDKVWTDYKKYFSESYLSYSLVNTCWLNSS